MVTEDKLRKRLPPPPSGNLYLHRPIEKESLKVNIFNPDGSYNVDAIQAASHMLRCRRTDTEKEMEPRLLAILSHVFDHFGERRIDVISGFRNQRKTTSYHYKGSAADIRIDGVSAAQAARRSSRPWTPAAWASASTRSPASCTSTCARRPATAGSTTRRSNPDAEQKKPPPWFKKKRLQS